MAKKKKSEKADEIIKNHVWFSTIPGWLPIPLIDLAAVTAVQIDMIKQLCEEAVSKDLRPFSPANFISLMDVF
jgi:uncharacterized protein (DUF697 family)